MSKIKYDLIPKSIICLKNYSRSSFISDILAGITVGLVALPLAMAFAIASGLPPKSGLYCAIVAGFIISAFGGSKTQIGGPTGAFVVVVSGIVSQYGVEGLFMCTLMAGVILAVIALARLGTAIRFIPRPVVIGFTNGIAVLIASTQIKDFFGIDLQSVPGDFMGRMSAIINNISLSSPITTIVACISLSLLILFRKYTPKIPSSIIVLVFGTIICYYFNLPLKTIVSEFGDIPQGFPRIEIPTIRMDLFFVLLSPAITVALLGAIESLLSAVVADRMSGDKHSPNTELLAQGFANIISPLFGGLPATGAIARTATNIRSGAKTPVAGMIHALTLLVILLIAAPLAGHIPLAILSAILFVVAYNMGEWSEIPEILRLNKSSRIVWGITFFLTVFADLTVAVEAGFAMAALLYINKVTSTTTLVKVTKEHVEADASHSLHLNPLPAETVMYRIHGPFLFGATEKLDLIYEELHTLPKIVILRLRNMNAIDATGLHSIQNLAKKLKETGRTLIVCGMRDQPKKMLKRAEFHEIVGEKNICESLQIAKQRAETIISGGID